MFMSIQIIQTKNGCLKIDTEAPIYKGDKAFDFIDNRIIEVRETGIYNMVADGLFTYYIKSPFSGKTMLAKIIEIK